MSIGRRSNRFALSAGGLAALAFLMGGCSNGPDLNGPFGDSPTQPVGAQGFRQPPGSVATMAMLSFSNSGGVARIEKVTLVGAHNLQLVDELVVRITGHDLIGVMGRYPTGHGPAFLAPGIHWAARQHAVGATIVHTPFPDSINLVLVLRASGIEGTAKDVYINYESEGTQYRLYFGCSIKLLNGNPPGS